MFYVAVVNYQTGNVLNSLLFISKAILGVLPSYLFFIITFKHSSANARSQDDLLLNDNIAFGNHIFEFILL